MTKLLWARVSHAFRRMAVPLVTYYTVTLVLPLANGAAQAGAVFVKHAVVVLVVPAVAIVAGCAVHTMMNFTSHKSQVRSHKSQVTSHKSQVTTHKSQVTSHNAQRTTHNAA